MINNCLFVKANLRRIKTIACVKDCNKYIYILFCIIYDRVCILWKYTALQYYVGAPKGKRVGN